MPFFCDANHPINFIETVKIKKAEFRAAACPGFPVNPGMTEMDVFGAGVA